MKVWKVGELARKAGLTVRTLHHYDAIGLLSPSERSTAGYRLYTAADLAHLTQVLTLRQLGLSLEQIRHTLADGDSLKDTLERHIAHCEAKLVRERRLLARLKRATASLAPDGASAEELTQILEILTMYEKYFTEAQLETLEARRQEVGQQAIESAQQEWPELIAKVRTAMQDGLDPENPEVRALAKRWMELVQGFTGGDPKIAEAVKTMYRQEPAMRDRAGIDPAMFEYVSRAMQGGD